MQLLIMKETRKNHFKGDIVEIRATGTGFGGSEPEAFVLAEVPELPMTDYEHYNGKWERIIDYEVVAQDKAQDGFRLRLFSTLVDSHLQGIVTKEAVEQYINSWGGSVHSFDTNEVVFDIRIVDAMQSPAFWEIPADEIVFTEIAYDQETGVHRIEIDYSARENSPTYVERYVRGKGATILSHANRVLTVDIPRSAVRQEFERDIAEKARKLIARRRYHVSEAVVDYIVSQGGYIQTDEATMLTYIKDKVAE